MHKYWFPLLLSGLATSFSVVQGDLTLASGYQLESFDQRHTGGTFENKRFNGPVFELSGLLSFSGDLYLRAKGSITPITSTPKQKTSSSSVLGKGSMSSTALATLGWQFDFPSRHYVFCIEGGYLWSRLEYNFTEKRHLETGLPFVGILWKWIMRPRWFVDMSFAYAFSGFRNEWVSTTHFQEGVFQGPLASAGVGYDLSRRISIGLKWTLRYLFTDRKTVGSFVNETTRWHANNITFDIGCNF